MWLCSSVTGKVLGFGCGCQVVLVYAGCGSRFFSFCFEGLSCLRYVTDLCGCSGDFCVADAMPGEVKIFGQRRLSHCFCRMYVCECVCVFNVLCDFCAVCPTYTVCCISYME